VTPLLLTRDDLQALTGHKSPAAMARWLRQRGWIHELPARQGDIPKVARAYFDARMTGAPLPGQRRVGPRLEFLTGT